MGAATTAATVKVKDGKSVECSSSSNHNTSDTHTVAHSITCVYEKRISPLLHREKRTWSYSNSNSALTRSNWWGGLPAAAPEQEKNSKKGAFSYEKGKVNAVMLPAPLLCCCCKRRDSIVRVENPRLDLFC